MRVAQKKKVFFLVKHFNEVKAEAEKVWECRKKQKFLSEKGKILSSSLLLPPRASQRVLLIDDDAV